VRKHGVDIAYTPMIHSRNFVNIKKYRAEVSDWLVSPRMGEPASTFDCPLIVQLCGHDPHTLVQAGRMIQGACPQGRVAAIDLSK
jgi:tRNA-dihydrouridine synthase 1